MVNNVEAGVLEPAISKTKMLQASAGRAARARAAGEQGGCGAGGGSSEQGDQGMGCLGRTLAVLSLNAAAGGTRSSA